MSKLSLSPNCLNCEHPVPPKEVYCGNCGQKHHDGKYSVGEVISEFISANFNLDAKIFRTLYGLMIPAFLTKEYFRGAHQSYYKPVRLFLVIGVIAFAFMQPNIEGDSEIVTELKEKRQRETLKLEWDTLRSTIQSYSSDDLLNRRLDTLTLVENLKKYEFDLLPSKSQSISNAKKSNSGFHISSGTKEMFLAGMDSTTLGNYKFSSYELIDNTPQELVDKYFIDEPWYEKMFFRQLLKSVLDGKGMLTAIFSKLPIILLIISPLYALIFHLLYIRRKKFFVEHFVFVLNLNSFSLLIALILVLAIQYLNFPEYLAFIPVLLYLLYFYVAMKRYYKQGWFKTFAKFILVQFLSMFAATFSLVLVLLISMLIY